VAAVEGEQRAHHRFQGAGFRQAEEQHTAGSNWVENAAGSLKVCSTQQNASPEQRDRQGCCKPLQGRYTRVDGIKGVQRPRLSGLRLSVNDL
jgi:hypothetical protein